MEVFSLTNPSQFSGNQTFRLANSLTFENFGGPDDFRKAFVSFFLSDTNSLHQIKSLLKAVNTTHEYCFEVDYFNLCSFSSPLSRMVLKHSLIYAVLEAALVEAQLKVKQAEPDPSVRSAMTLKGADEDSFTQQESQSQSQGERARTFRCPPLICTVPAFPPFPPPPPPSHKKMRLSKPATTVSKFERLKPPYVGVTVDSVIRPLFSN